MKQDQSGRKSDVRKAMRRLNTGTSREVKTDRRIIERAQKIFHSTDWNKDGGLKFDKKLAQIFKSQKHSDGWMNFFTGLNVPGKDSRTGNRVIWEPMEEVMCEQVYGGDKIARRLVELLPDNAMREWITMRGLDPDQLTAVNKEVDRLKVRKRFKQGWQFARLYGGAGTLVNVDDGQEDLIVPLDINNIKSVKSLWTFGRFELEVLAADVEYDLNSENFGMPNLYMLVPRNRTDQSIQMQRQIIKFHHSRIIRWDGMQLPRRIEITNRYWGDSVLSPFLDILRDHKNAVGTLAHILADFRVSIIKMKGLADMIANNQEDSVHKRIELMNLAKSVVGSLLIDADEEDFSYMTSSLEGVTDIIDTLKKDMTASQDAPHNVLFNESPAGGLNGAGESNMRTWYDFIHSQQDEYLRPNLLRLFEILMNSSEGPTAGQEPDDWTFTFNSLWQQTDEEIAKTRYQTAQADDIYLNHGVLQPQEVRDSRFGGDEYSQETELDENLSAVQMPLPGTVDATGNPVAAPQADASGVVPSNLDPALKMNPPAGAGSPGTGTTPEMVGNTPQSTAMQGVADNIDHNTGQEKEEGYVNNLYKTFVQDGAKMYRLDGDALKLFEVFVSARSVKDGDAAMNVAKLFGFKGKGMPKTDGMNTTGWSFMQKKLGSNMGINDFVIKEPMMGIRLYFGKSKK